VFHLLLKLENFQTASVVYFLIFQEKISQDLSTGKSETVPTFNDLYSKYVGTETEKKTAADQTLRDLIKDEINSFDQSNSSTAITNILDIYFHNYFMAKCDF